MDLAHNLIRSTVRSFYPPEQILIVDALLQHNALLDDDLAYLMGQQRKQLRKVASKLKDDGMIAIHSRPEIREGNTRPNNRDYFFIDYHRTIDVIKYRLKRMTKAIEEKYGQAPEEKKDYVCKRCLSEYTQMEVLDMVTPRGFLCRKCHAILEAREEGDPTVSSAGHEVQGRLNAQLKAFEELMRRIDDAEIPENDFDKAIANALPVQRNSETNPGVRSQPVLNARLPAATVRGMKTEEKITVNLVGEGEENADEKAEADRKAKAAAQNQLPVWHTTSTVTGPVMSSAPDGASFGTSATSTEEEKKPNPASLKTGSDDERDEKEDVKFIDMEDFWAQYNAEQAIKAQQEADEEDDDDDEEEEDEDEDGFEDVPVAAGGQSGAGIKTEASNGDSHARKRSYDSSADPSPQKRVKVEDLGPNGVGSASESASTSQAATPAALPNGTGDAVKKEAAETKKESGDEEDDDDDDDGFEDAL